jgi:hypothetical protein
LLLVRYTVLLSLVVGAAAGCAGNGEGLDANGQPIGSAPPGAPPPGSPSVTPDFQSIQDNVFTPICTQCHIGAGAPQGLQLDEAHSYALLVGIPSAEQPNVLRVSPGNPDDSYLVRKLEGPSAGISGGQMPLNQDPLAQSTIDAIRQWITNGALQSMATGIRPQSAPVQRFAVTVTSPDDQSVLTQQVPRIVAAFNHEIDATLVNDTTVSLERLGMMPDTTAMDSSDARAEQLPISTGIVNGNPQVIMITPRTPLGNGMYRVTLRGAGGAALAGVSAGTLGVDYSFTFTVDVSP